MNADIMRNDKEFPKLGTQRQMLLPAEVRELSFQARIPQDSDSGAKALIRGVRFVFLCLDTLRGEECFPNFMTP